MMKQQVRIIMIQAVKRYDYIRYGKCNLLIRTSYP